MVTKTPPESPGNRQKNILGKFFKFIFNFTPYEARHRPVSDLLIMKGRNATAPRPTDRGSADDLEQRIAAESMPSEMGIEHKDLEEVYANYYSEMNELYWKTNYLIRTMRENPIFKDNPVLAQSIELEQKIKEIRKNIDQGEYHATEKERADALIALQKEVHDIDRKMQEREEAILKRGKIVSSAYAMKMDRKSEEEGLAKLIEQVQEKKSEPTDTNPANPVPKPAEVRSAVAENALVREESPNLAELLEKQPSVAKSAPTTEPTSRDDVTEELPLGWERVPAATLKPLSARKQTLYQKALFWGSMVITMAAWLGGVAVVNDYVVEKVYRRTPAKTAIAAPENSVTPTLLITSTEKKAKKSGTTVEKKNEPVRTPRDERPRPERTPPRPDAYTKKLEELLRNRDGLEKEFMRGGHYRANEASVLRNVVLKVAFDTSHDREGRIKLNTAADGTTLDIEVPGYERFNQGAGELSVVVKQGKNVYYEKLVDGKAQLSLNKIAAIGAETGTFSVSIAKRIYAGTNTKTGRDLLGIDSKFAYKTTLERMLQQAKTTGEAASAHDASSRKDEKIAANSHTNNTTTTSRMKTTNESLLPVTIDTTALTASTHYSPTQASSRIEVTQSPSLYRNTYLGRLGYSDENVERIEQTVMKEYVNGRSLAALTLKYGNWFAAEKNLARRVSSSTVRNMILRQAKTKTCREARARYGPLRT